MTLSNLQKALIAGGVTAGGLGIGALSAEGQGHPIAGAITGAGLGALSGIGMNQLKPFQKYLHDSYVPSAAMSKANEKAMMARGAYNDATTKLAAGGLTPEEVDAHIKIMERTKRLMAGVKKAGAGAKQKDFEKRQRNTTIGSSIGGAGLGAMAGSLYDNPLGA